MSIKRKGSAISENDKKDHADLVSNHNIKVDDEGYIICQQSQRIGKYEILETIGKGTFSTVVHVKDAQTNKNLAMKISRNLTMSIKAGEREIELLNKILKWDASDSSLCMRMLDAFDYQTHVFIVFDKLGLSIYDFHETNKFQPFLQHQIHHIGYQLCHAVNFLHKNGVTHTDLKPDNILLVDSSYTMHPNHDYRVLKHTNIRLTDFGCAVCDGEPQNTIIGPKPYRSPEVILELGWSQPNDVWQIGCVLFELYIGDLLFVICDDPKSDAGDHLATMEKILGPFPSNMKQRTKTNLFSHKPDVGDTCFPLNKYMRSMADEELFYLMKRMLEYEPSQRITLDEALKHSILGQYSVNQHL